MSDITTDTDITTTTNATTLPDDNTEYGRHEYWEARFTTEPEYDWLTPYSGIKTLINQHMPDKTASILIIGCGNSTLTADLFNDGYTNVISTDYSETVIAKMREKYAELPIQWQVQDMTKLTYEQHSFDYVLDKCAMDALCVNEGSPWDPSEDVCRVVDQMLTGIIRVLKPAGKYIQISFGQPHFRKANYFVKEEYNWEVKHHVFGEEKGFGYFFYTLQKLNRPLSEQTNQSINQ